MWFCVRYGNGVVVVLHACARWRCLWVACARSDWYAVHRTVKLKCMHARAHLLLRVTRRECVRVCETECGGDGWI